ncbi:MAG: hypothetical protein EOO04_34360 [Chitinophagaceae bacterium]|nr:MAG: hypothetical protein EOO04_34360 [Chitinophagaceae bacterium]
MNTEVAREVFSNYKSEMNYEQFIEALAEGLEIVAKHPVNDKLYMSRKFTPDQLKAVRLALEYNQDLMVKLLLQ